MCTRIDLAKLERFTAYRHFIETMQITRDKLNKEYKKNDDPQFKAIIDSISAEIEIAQHNRDKFSFQEEDKRKLRLVS